MKTRYSTSTVSLVGLVIVSFFFFIGTATAADGDDSQYEHAARLYDTYCAQCHGLNRDGNGINSADMSVQPRDHSDPKGMGDIPNSEILEVIEKGGLAADKSVLMPPWGGVLSEGEIEELAAYLRHICQCGTDK